MDLPTYLGNACSCCYADRPQQVVLLGASKAALLHTIIQGLCENTAKAGMPQAGSSGERVGRHWLATWPSLPANVPVHRVQVVGTLLTHKAVWLQSFEECSKYF